MRARRTPRGLLAAATVAGLLLAACGAPDGATAGAPDDADAALPDERPESDEPVEQPEPDEPSAFDRSEARERAESLLGRSEDDVEESATVRVMRRGDEQLPGTMDLRPGRLNLELDEVDGEYRVTRVVVEVPDGEDELVVE